MSQTLPLAPGDGTVKEYLGVPYVWHYGSPQEEYQALTQRAGLVDLGPWTQLELTGADRAALLHNLCTNDIRGLAGGHGCEAFLCSAQGRVLAHIWIYAGQQSHVVETVPLQGPKLLQHLDRYVFREQVVLHDRTAAWSELLLAGPQAAAVLQAAGADAAPSEPLAHAACRIGSLHAWVRCVEWLAVPGLAVVCPAESKPALAAVLYDAGAARCGMQAFDVARLEAGTPWYGCDITDRNLPQEVARDARAIHFRKGCYVGQETVARIDALGHVNQTLVGVRWTGGEIPAAGSELRSEGKVVGRVTSAAYSFRLGCPVGLAYVRRGFNHAGQVLESDVGAAVVESFPMT
jgi:folate-binding protein YgfZ